VSVSEALPTTTGKEAKGGGREKRKRKKIKILLKNCHIDID